VGAFVVNYQEIIYAIYVRHGSHKVFCFIFFFFLFIYFIYFYLFFFFGSFQSVDVPLTVAQLDDLVARLDTDGDGSVDLKYVISYDVTSCIASHLMT
jgi:hypothetical protein